jgi:type II secretory pathway component PulJ
MLRNNRGETLVEILVAIGIFAVAGSTAIMMVFSAFQSGRLGGQETQAEAVLREGVEAIQTMSMGAFNAVESGTYGLSDAGGTWELSGTSDTDGVYTRTVTIADTQRNGSGDIGAGTNDPYTRTITIAVNWTRDGVPHSLSQTTYATAWDSTNTTHDTTSDWNAGSYSSTTTTTTGDSDGAVSLEAISSYWACTNVQGVYDKVGTADGSEVFVSGNYAYLGTLANSSGAEFFIVNISNPLAPVLTGSLEIGADVNGIYVSGNYAYLATSSDTAEFRIINVTTPSAPVSLSTLNLSGNEDLYDVVVSGTYAYLGRANAATQEFIVVNVGTPSAPTVSGSLEVGANVNGVALSGSYVYLATGVDAGEFRVVNVSVSTAPTSTGTLNLPTTTDANDVAIYGSYAYVVTASNTTAPGGDYYVIDISTPSTPTQSGYLDLGTGGNTIQMDGTGAIVGTGLDGRSIMYIDNTSPTAPVLSTYTNTGADDVNALYWTGSMLYAATTGDNNELYVVNRRITSSWNCPELKANDNSATTAVDGNAVFVVGSTMYGVTTSAAGADFFIWDISTPTAPSLLGTLDLGATAYDIVVSGNYAYIASGDNNQELQVVSVASPSAPVLVGAYNASGSTDATAVAISGTKVMLGQGTVFYNINVATPSSPTLLGSVTLGGTIFRIRPYNATYAFVANSDNSNEVRVVNFSANTPTVAGGYNTSGTGDGRDVAIKGTTAYLVTDVNTSTSELFVLNVSTPTAPTLTGSLELGANSRAVAVDDDENYVFVGVATAGNYFRVIDVSTPSAPVVNALIPATGNTMTDIKFANDILYTANTMDTAEFAIYGKVSGSGGASGYVSSGTYQSAVINSGSASGANWNVLLWSESLASCPSVDVRLQVRTATSSGGLSTELWQGPDGEDADETDYFTIPEGELIDITHNGDGYMQYRASLSGNGTCTPLLTDLTINRTGL